MPLQVFRGRRLVLSPTTEAVALLFAVIVDYIIFIFNHLLKSFNFYGNGAKLFTSTVGEKANSGSKKY